MYMIRKWFKELKEQVPGFMIGTPVDCQCGSIAALNGLKIRSRAANRKGTLIPIIFLQRASNKISVKKIVKLVIRETRFSTAGVFIV
jgi:hypothetical protein